MVKSEEILSKTVLQQMMDEKRINVQHHPNLPLRVFNYSNRAQFIGAWSLEERVCRGLIVDDEDNVVARGPSKFFNYGQPGAPEVALDDKVWVTRKEDGSLGIGWEYLGHYGVATRGSFASDQAIHATSLLTKEDKARILLEQQKGRTQIWEIVYPENRIVLNYKGLDKLIKLGGVRNTDGLITLRPMNLFMSITPGGNPEMTFAEALALPIPADEEGYVIDVHSTDHDTVGHIKLKGARYKELHGAIFGLSERKIWESMGRGDDMEDFVAALPDELMPWAQGVVDRIESEKVALFQSIGSAMAILKAMLQSKGWDISRMSDIPRGEIARLITTNHKEISGPLFSYLDNRLDAVEEWAHKQVRPEHKLFRVENEDAN